MTATAIATAVACAAPLALLAATHASPTAAYAALDFNAALFEDFLGPYWRSAGAVLESPPRPDAQYVYPPTLAVLLSLAVPLGDAAGSWLALVLVVASVAALAAAALLLRPPTRPVLGPVALGLLLGLSFPVVHGAYWANAGLFASAAAALGWALALRDRAALGGGLVGFAVALKPTPVLVLVGLALCGKKRATAAALVALAAFLVAFPVAALGVEDARAFAAESARALARLRVEVLEGGARGSLDIASVVDRLGGAAIGRGAGLAVAVAVVLTIVARAVWALRAPGAKRGGAVVVLLALPSLAVLPSWPHGFAWVPLGVWLAWPRAPFGARGALVAAAAVAASLPLALAVGPPARFIGSGALTATAVLVVAALLLGERPAGPVTRT